MEAGGDIQGGRNLVAAKKAAGKKYLYRKMQSVNDLVDIGNQKEQEAGRVRREGLIEFGANWEKPAEEAADNYAEAVGIINEMVEYMKEYAKPIKELEDKIRSLLKQSRRKATRVERSFSDQTDANNV